jgi:hypothetical protein
MPDHLHFVWIGADPTSDQLKGMRFLRTYLARAIKPARFQPQPHDHVFTVEERLRHAFSKACEYILLNPIRAELVQNSGTWPYFGGLIPGYPNVDPLTPTFWPTFWKIFSKLRNPNCSQHTPIRRLYNSK